MVYILLAVSLIIVAIKARKLVFGSKDNRFRAIDKKHTKKRVVLATFFTKYILRKKMETIQSIEEKLQWVGIEDEVHLFICRPYIAFLGSMVFGAILAWFSRSNTMVGYGMIAIGIIIGFINYKKYTAIIRHKEKEKKMNIVLEMPRFIKTIQYSPSSKSLDHILVDYIPHAKKGLKNDLVLLLANIKSGMSENQALKRFANKINIPEVTELVYILDITGVHSTNAQVSLQFLSTKFRERSHYLIEKELSKRPEKMAMLNDLLLNILALLILVPVAINAFEGINNIIK